MPVHVQVASPALRYPPGTRDRCPGSRVDRETREWIVFFARGYDRTDLMGIVTERKRESTKKVRKMAL